MLTLLGVACSFICLCLLSKASPHRLYWRGRSSSTLLKCHLSAVNESSMPLTTSTPVVNFEQHLLAAYERQTAVLEAGFRGVREELAALNRTTKEQFSHLSRALEGIGPQFAPTRNGIGELAVAMREVTEKLTELLAQMQENPPHSLANISSEFSSSGTLRAREEQQEDSMPLRKRRHR
ncbi:emerin (Emery-Dreifuss muscular dystrophy) isoform X2 [Latimeria chalumnae]|uniref:emerin (Emery-Dreifuss muscular dystrophy) isoform X2 n=1 Tax=Latimeria chalumnae TaxID=7897 RepID=UPI0006D8E66C|nr:PREDICTED: uncharacterized protein LOC106705254 [Latimeria chalumnae]|eukprot:XP_014349647.1 PREDICTED: uncharacterized protein LOC106705254 [Latimeria chalumnae]